MVTPLMPSSLPTSITWLATLIKSKLCSITITESPLSTILFKILIINKKNVIINYMSREILKYNFKESFSKNDYIKNLMDRLEETICKLYNEDFYIKKVVLLEIDEICTECIDAIDHINYILSDSTNGRIISLNNKTFTEIKNTFNIDINNLFSQNSLNYINFLFSFFFEEFWERNHGKCYGDLKFDAFDKSGINHIINISSYYFLKVEKLVINFLEEKYLIDIINDKNLEELFSSYKTSKTTADREIYMTNISKKIRAYFNDRDYIDQTNILDKELTKKERRQISKYLNGYFSHYFIDRKSKDARNWAKLNDNKKDKIMEKIFIDILYCLSILRINNLLL